jgi:D-serine ammonia-lyase
MCRLCDAAAIAMSKDTGPSGGYGAVVSPSSSIGWRLQRISQEHGTLVWKGDITEEVVSTLAPGQVMRIAPQHACLTAAQHAWYYVVDGGEVVVDVWVPWKGW